MTEAFKSLLEYVARFKHEQTDALAIEVASDTPDFVGAWYLDKELMALWPSLPAEARLIAVLLATQIAREICSDDE